MDLQCRGRRVEILDYLKGQGTAKQPAIVVRLLSSVTFPPLSPKLGHGM